MEELFAKTANLLAEPTRARMLLKLLSGKALPAGELASAARVSPQTASGHLSKLMRANLLRVEDQGRHRYYRLARTEVADAIEAMLVLIPGDHKEQREPVLPEAGTLAYARTCYSHLAGWLAWSADHRRLAGEGIFVCPSEPDLCHQRNRKVLACELRGSGRWNRCFSQL